MTILRVHYWKNPPIPLLRKGELYGTMVYMKKGLFGKFPTLDVKKYGGKQVAILDGVVIATGKTLAGVIRAARKQAPGRHLNEIHIFSVPRSMTVIYFYGSA